MQVNGFHCVILSSNSAFLFLSVINSQTNAYTDIRHKQRLDIQPCETQLYCGRQYAVMEHPLVQRQPRV